MDILGPIGHNIVSGADLHIDNETSNIIEVITTLFSSCNLKIHYQLLNVPILNNKFVG